MKVECFETNDGTIILSRGDRAWAFTGGLIPGAFAADAGALADGLDYGWVGSLGGADADRTGLLDDIEDPRMWLVAVWDDGLVKVAERMGSAAREYIGWGWDNNGEPPFGRLD